MSKSVLENPPRSQDQKEFAIRVAEPVDREAVTGLLGRSYRALMTGAYDAETLEHALPLITRANSQLLKSGSYYLAVLGDGRVVGAGGWTRTSPTGQGQTALNGNIRHFGTDPAYTGCGIGRALMNRCIGDAAQDGLQELNCYSSLNGERFYAACGFVRIEAFDVTLPGDVKFPSVRMVRKLIP